MGIKKITKKEYVNTIKNLKNPFNCVQTFIKLNFERAGVNGDDHDEIMDYLIKFLNYNDGRINEILTDHPQYCNIIEKSRDFNLIKLNGEVCWEQKKGLFYTFEMNGKLFIIHQYNDNQNSYSIKCSFI